MKRIIWSRPAQNDLAHIDQFLAEFDPAYAALVGRQAFKTAIWLAENPRIAPFVEDAEIRKWRVPTTPYLLLYYEAPDGITIARVRHARENWREEV